MDGIRSRGRLPALLAALVMAAGPLCGCQTVRLPEEVVAQTNVPREGNKITMPPHRIEPPDLVLVEVLEPLPGRPISGERLVRPDGTITLGFYGDVYVTGLTLDEAKEKIIFHLREFLSDEALGLVRIGEDGEPEPVPAADSEKVVVDVTAYNSKYYYVQGDVNFPNRYPVTGNETVLDAINFAGGLTAFASNVNVRLVRPAPAGACCEQVLPINLPAIINAGDVTTNYQLMPGDRIVVYRDPLVRFNLLIARLSEPFQAIANGVLTYAIAARSVNLIDFIGFGFGGGGGGAGGANAGTTTTTNAPLIDPTRSAQ